MTSKDRHGDDLRKQMEEKAAEAGRKFKSQKGTVLVDVDDGERTDHVVTEAGTVVPSVVDMHTVKDSHGEHEVPRTSGGAIAGVDDPKKAKYGTKGVTKRTIGKECTDIVSVEEDFYP